MNCSVRIYDQLTAQTAYILAVYRYRPEAVEAIERMIERYATERKATPASRRSCIA